MKFNPSLLSQIKNRRCILFLGAGATKSSGGVLGNELGKHIYDSIGDIGIPYKDNLARYTQTLVNKGHRDDIEKIVRERFIHLEPNESFSKITSVPWKAIYTTNYDDLVEKSYAKQQYFRCKICDPKILSTCINSTDIPLYKINGDINTTYQQTNPLVITLNDLKQNKSKNQAMINQLMLDMNDTFIFVGYSFQDQNEIITEILDHFSECERWESIKEKYVILPSISEDTKLDLESYKIQYIQGTADEFFDLVSAEAERDYRVKLNFLAKPFLSNNYFKNLDAITIQYLKDCFDIFNNDEDYPVDSRNYYRGGKANWGIIKNHFDISRNLSIMSNDNIEINTSTDLLYQQIQEILQNKKLQKILLIGTAISGKTTALYRLAHDLVSHGDLALIFKQQAKYESGLLPTIYKKNSSPFVVLIDDIFIDSQEVIKMINDCKNNNVPVVFLFTSRYSEWSNVLSNYHKTVLDPIDYTITMKDTFNSDEASTFVNKLIESKLIVANNNMERNGYIQKFKESKNIIEVLVELIDTNNYINSISNEYDNLSEETKYSYGLISLIHKYEYKLRWEVLQRILEKKYGFTWNDFIEKILKNDAQGNMYSDELQGNYYIYGRHRFICSMIVKIHFSGNYSEEICAIKKIISSSAGIDSDEYFIGGLLNSMLKDDNLEYTKEQILDLLDYTIDNFNYPKNKAFINHLKGEFHISQSELSEAIKCFDSNINNHLNVEYSLHSLGKAYFYLAQESPISSGTFRIHIDTAIEKLMNGVKKYSKNVFYYRLLLSIFNFLDENNMCSEKNNRSLNDLEDMGIKNLGNKEYNVLKKNLSSATLSMD